MNNELAIISEHLLAAFVAEDVFGQLSGDKKEKQNKAKQIYRKLAKTIHPDGYKDEDKDCAHKAFQRLSELYQEALEKIRLNIYGKGEAKKEEAKELKTKKHHYQDMKLYCSGELADIYSGKFSGDDKKIRQVAIKIVADPENSDLMITESKVLKNLNDKAEGKMKIFKRYLPYVYDTFSFRNKGERYIGNVFKLYDDYYSLREVSRAYPQGIDGRAIAWMINRLLEILGFIHQSGLVHGGITPDHVLIHPTKHGVKLLDWTTAVAIGERVKIMSAEFSANYPAEVKNKEQAGSETDIYMLAACMKSLFNKDVPDSIKKWIDKCLLAKKAKRPNDAWQLREEFEQILSRTYGGRKYHEFTMTKHYF